MADRYGALQARAVRGTLHRIVPSRFPPVKLFEVARDAEELELLAELEGLTNDRLRDELGELHLVPREDRLTGPGSSPIMAAFCHPAPSRFTDGTFGVYYAGLEEETAIIETIFHRERILRDASMPPETLEMRRYTTTLRKPLTLLPTAQRDTLLDPDSYVASQAFGRAMKARKLWGLYYPSVRHAPEGRCVAVLRPIALAPAKQASHYRYYWNGQAIDRYERIEAFEVER